MNHRKLFRLAALATVVLLAQIAVAGQSAGDGKAANVSGGGSLVRWDILVPNNGGTLTVSFPDGRSIRKTFRAGTSPEFNLSEKQYEGLPDGFYTYELQLAPVMQAGAREAMMKARAKDDDSESDRTGRKRATLPSVTQSGAFSIVNGSVIVGGAVEGQRSTAKTPAKPRAAVSFTSANTVSRLRNHRLSLGFMADDVIPDDLIVQGSACVGLDCVSGESFGFDSLRLKENNTRLQFDDTSTSAGFPTNNWQIRANGSGSGAASFLAFVDQGASGNSETGTIVFEVDAGAPANSLRVSSSGKVGIRTATPVLDVHVNSSDTPANRLEQNNSGGFTAQTWDIAGNEANFFVRDVTSGSRLPFRIRPGAPTSSVDISANGNVGIGTASPNQKVHMFNSGAQDNVLLTMQNGTREWSLGVNGASDFFRITDQTAGLARLTILNNGRIGVGTSAPDQVFSVNGDASKTGGGSWQVFSDERLKNIQGKYNRGLSAVMRLQPLFYEYKSDNALGLKSEGQHVGFGAQALQQVIPEAVTKTAEGYLMVNNDPIIWTMLNAIKEQQKEIADLKAQVQKLRATSRRHRR